MLGKNKSNSTPRRSAPLSKGKVATPTPFTTPPVNLAASASKKSTGQRPPLVPKTGSNKKRTTPTLSSSSKKRRAAASLTSHKPREMKVNKQIRDTLLTDKSQKWLRATTEEGKAIKVNLQKYEPSKEPFLGMSIDYCVNYHGRHSVPPDLPNSSVLLKQLCLRRVPAEYPENTHVSRKPKMLDYLKETFDMPLKEVSAIIESISEADLVAAARAHAPTVVNADAPISAPHPAASPSTDSIMESLRASASVCSNLAESQAANQSAIAGLAESQATFQAASRERHEANESKIAGLAQAFREFQAASQERHEASEAEIRTNRSAIACNAQEKSNLKKAKKQHLKNLKWA